MVDPSSTLKSTPCPFGPVAGRPVNNDVWFGKVWVNSTIVLAFNVVAPSATNRSQFGVAVAPSAELARPSTETRITGPASSARPGAMVTGFSPIRTTAAVRTAARTRLPTSLLSPAFVETVTCPSGRRQSQIGQFGQLRSRVVLRYVSLCSMAEWSWEWV